jgi:5'-nucleotidase/UDP-sugar diphosphatase
MNWKLLLLAVTLVGVAVAGLLLRVEEEESLELTILHTNDLHAHYDSFEPWGEPIQGGVARLKTAVDEIRGEIDNVLLLDAGDQFQGTLFFTVGGAKVVADVMNELGYDAMCLGNHEFDSGPTELATFIDLTDFLVVSANTDALADPDLSGEILPYALAYFGFDREPVAIVGLTAEHTAIASSPGPNVRFLDAIPTAQRTVDELEESGIDVIIALTHLGYERDLDLAGSIDGIDVIVGGHSHTLLGTAEGAAGPYPTVVASASGEPVLVVTAGEWGSHLGRLDVTFTGDGLVKSYGGAPIFIDGTIPEDEQALDVLAGYRPAIEGLMTRVVGAADVDLNGVREDVRARETNLGNLICDAMLWKTASLGATIAIQNGGGIRASIPAGEITMGQILEVLPYGNQISVLSVTGLELIEALENGVSQVQDGAGCFPHVGGMRYTFDPSAEPGARVISVEVWDATSEAFAALDSDATYTLATNSFLADGGDGYSAFALSFDRYDTGWLLSDTLAEYIGNQEPRVPETEGRVTEATK